MGGEEERATYVIRRLLILVLGLLSSWLVLYFTYFELAVGDLEAVKRPERLHGGAGVFVLEEAVTLGDAIVILDEVEVLGGAEGADEFLDVVIEEVDRKAAHVKADSFKLLDLSVGLLEMLGELKMPLSGGQKAYFRGRGHDPSEELARLLDAQLAVHVLDVVEGHERLLGLEAHALHGDPRAARTVLDAPDHPLGA